MHELVAVEGLKSHAGKTVRIGGWVTHCRAKGKLVFAVVRDGTGVVQCVFFKGDLDEAAFAAASALAIEPSVVGLR